MSALLDALARYLEVRRALGTTLAEPGRTLAQFVTFLEREGSPRISTALEYFYTATPDCLPGGPHFDYTYFIAYTGIVGALIGLLGVGLYQVALSGLRYRPVLLITTTLSALAGFSDLSMVLRFNVWLGIPDTVAYMLGEAMLEPLLGMLAWIPVSALISMACEPGREACSFAYMAGLSNFARMVSTLSGAVIIEWSGVGGNLCNFDFLWVLVLSCHIVLPLVVGVAAVWIIPDMRQDE